MYNLSIEVDNQNVSSGNVDVEGTDFYGCGCQASGQCGAVMGYWDDDRLVVLLSDEGCGSSEGQILSGGGIYEFEEEGSGSLNGDNSFGLSDNGVQAYVTYLMHEGGDVVVSDRQSINATVRFVPVIEEVVPEAEGVPAAEVEDGSAVAEEEVPGMGVEESVEIQGDATRGDLEGAEGKEGEDALAAVLVSGESVDVSQVGQRDEVPVEGMLTGEIETLLEVPGPEVQEGEPQEQQQEYGFQEELLGGVLLGDGAAGEEEDQELGSSEPEVALKVDAEEVDGDELELVASDSEARLGEEEDRELRSLEPGVAVALEEGAAEEDEAELEEVVASGLEEAVLGDAEDAAEDGEEAASDEEVA